MKFISKSLFQQKRRSGVTVNFHVVSLFEVQINLDHSLFATLSCFKSQIGNVRNLQYKFAVHAHAYLQHKTVI